MSTQDNKRRVAEELAGKARQIVADPESHYLDDIGVSNINVWLNDWLSRLPGRPQTGYNNVQQVYDSSESESESSFDADVVLRDATNENGKLDNHN